MSSVQQPLKVGILSDTHGWIDPRVCAVLAEADCIVHAGDVIGASVLDALRELAREGEVVAVAGNNDRGCAEEALAGLPTVAEIPLPGGALVVTHGDQFGRLPAHDQIRQAWPTARAIVYGHTHQIVCDQTAAPWVLNPGAAGRVRVKQGPSCFMLLADTGAWEIETHQFEE